MHLFIIIFLIYPIWGIGDDRFIGCFKDRPVIKTFSVIQYTTIDQCIEICNLKYYRYSFIRNIGDCVCSNYLGEEVNTTKCDDYCQNCDIKRNLSDVYSTGNILSGPPRNLQVSNITSNSIHLSWEAPESYTDIISYQIKPRILSTYSSFKPNTPLWKYPNNTFRTNIINLLPATKYNIILNALSSDGEGATINQTIETNIDEPDNIPQPPKILNREKNRLKVQLNSVTNNNGPISSYYVVVINEDSKQIFQKDLLKSYDEAKNNGINYYIAAELNPDYGDRIFVVGDGHYYGKYYNAPLNSNSNYNILLGVVSRLNGITKIIYSDIKSKQNIKILTSDDNIDEFLNDNNNSPAVIISLSIAIGLLSFLFVAGIIGFFILRSKVTTHRQRLSDNQELTLQGPMIEVENNGYIPEEEQLNQRSKLNHYKNLKEKLKAISFNQLKIEPTNLLGIGKFGRVNSGTIYENNTLIPVAVYNISDKKLNNENRRNMLKDLDILIRTGKHEFIINLLGICETSQLFVILEYVSMNLKDLLLGSRDSLPDRFSNMNEIQALNIALNIVKGLNHLDYNKIVHNQICARNILIANGFIPKISGYGLAQYYSHNNLPDFTRWTSLELFKGQIPNRKSDVWSFGCLLWEICVLGGTPYGNFSNNEIPDRIKKGLRLQQLPYMSDDLYQIMLNCWQIDLDERPTFLQLIELIDDIKQQNGIIKHLNFNLYENFQYEQFSPNMEIALRPVF